MMPSSPIPYALSPSITDSFNEENEKENEEEREGEDEDEEEVIRREINEAQNPQHDFDDSDQEGLTSSASLGLENLFGQPDHTLSRDQRLVIQAAYNIFGIMPTDISKKLKIPRSTVHRVIHSQQITPSKRKPRKMKLADSQVDNILIPLHIAQNN